MHAKAIIVDLDRTLLRTDKTISPYTMGVLKDCRKNAIKLMVATARPLRDIEQYHTLLGFDAMTVSNGARLLCGNQKIEHPISIESAENVLSLLQRDPALRITLETGDRAYSNLPIADYETTINEDLIGLAKTEGALKLLTHIDDERILKMIQTELPQNLYYTVANGYLLQIMNRSATKWNGIQEMLKISNCTAVDAIYFGDDHDDIEPIKRCGIGVAVANAIDEVKAAADHITASNDEDGVAKFIERFLLNG